MVDPTAVLWKSSSRRVGRDGPHGCKKILRHGRNETWQCGPPKRYVNVGL